MRDIFQGASLTVAWLGESAVDTDQAFDVLQGETFDRDNLMSLIPFVSRPYWSRVWIIQEICVSDDILIVCGKRILPWSSMFEERMHAII
jgi:hypothetical protein